MESCLVVNEEPDSSDRQSRSKQSGKQIKTDGEHSNTRRIFFWAGTRCVSLRFWFLGGNLDC